MKIKINYFFVISFMGLIFLQPQVFAEEPKATLETYLNSSKTFEAEFEQSLFAESGTLHEVASGKFYLSRPGKFRWDYNEPYEQAIIADGEKIWIYDIDLEQVTVRKMSDVLSNTPALLLSNELAISDEYVVTMLEDEKELEWFVLKPKDEENQYIDIRFAFDHGNIRSMELRDNFGQITRILFSDINKNQVIAPELFNFKPPEGVDVLDTIE